MITRIAEKISAASTPVITDCAITLGAPKNKVKAIVSTAPMKSTNQITFGTVPSAMTSRSRRAWVN